jgi:AMP-binding enzyme
MPDKTAETIVDGWLHTGDLGVLDERGYLFLRDRSREVIITGGFNVYPRNIERIDASGQNHLQNLKYRPRPVGAIHTISAKWQRHGNREPAGRMAGLRIGSGRHAARGRARGRAPVARGPSGRGLQLRPPARGGRLHVLDAIVFR